jgi:putative heme transporter
VVARARPRLSRRRLLFAAIGIVVVFVTFAYALPQIADYRDVWEVLSDVSWAWTAGLVGATVLNLVTFAPPWQIVLPGLPFRSALILTQVSTALAMVVPGGAAVGIAGAYGILRRWGFRARDIGRAVTVVSVWNQFANLSYPAIAVVLLAVFGGDSPVLRTAGFVGATVLGVAIVVLGAVLSSDRTATALGDLAARVADRVLAGLRREPVAWSGASFERFRGDAADLLRRRWHVLTLATYAGTLTVFLVLFAALRALDVPSSEISLVEAFAAWSLARLLGTIPITPGGVGVVELGLTGALLGFGGNNAGVVAAVLLYRFLTMIPTIVLGLIAATTARGHTVAFNSPAD